MASTQLEQLAERAAAATAARSRYVCRIDMAPAAPAALRHANMPVAPEPGIAAPAAPMPISETTTSWLVVMDVRHNQTNSSCNVRQASCPSRSNAKGKLGRDGARAQLAFRGRVCVCVV
ncbi:unnamed protein product, partial [Alopecurus aequalis]